MNAPKLSNADKERIKFATLQVLKYTVCLNCDDYQKHTESEACRRCRIKVMKEILDEDATKCSSYIKENPQDCKCGIFQTRCRGLSCQYYDLVKRG